MGYIATSIGKIRILDTRLIPTDIEDFIRLFAVELEIYHIQFRCKVDFQQYCLSTPVNLIRFSNRLPN